MASEEQIAMLKHIKRSKNPTDAFLSENYPSGELWTKAESDKWIEDLKTKIESQGRIADALWSFDPDNARQQFKNPPEVFFKDKEVCVTGKIILYKDKPEIVVYEEKQIVLK